MSTTYNIRAVVLDRRPWGETDSLVTLYARGTGRLDLSVRGARKPGSKLAGHLEPLNLVEAMVVRGRRQNYIGAAVATEAFAGLKGEYARAMLAAEALAWTKRLTAENVEDDRIYDLLVSYLQILSDPCPPAVGQDGLYAAYRLKLADLLGFGPTVEFCLDCGRPIETFPAWFNAGAGGAYCRSCRRDAALTVEEDWFKMLRSVRERELREFSGLVFGTETKRRFNIAINSFFEYHFQ